MLRASPSGRICISYNFKTRQPDWVYEHIAPSSTSPRHEFTADTAIPALFRVAPTAFKGSGFDRGHLAAAANHDGDENVMTYAMSNISPQQGEGMNRGYWRQLEAFVRRLRARYEQVHTLTGPLFDPATKRHGRVHKQEGLLRIGDVPVPTHFYKIVLCWNPGKPKRVASFVLPNAPIQSSVPLVSFLMPMEELQRRTGLDLGAETRQELCAVDKCHLKG